MQETTIARSYAEALLELALADDEVELYEGGLGLLADLMRSDDDFRSLLETPRIAASEKKEVLRSVFEGKVPVRLLHFFLLVIDKRRSRLLLLMADEFSDLVDEQFGRIKIEVTTADEPDAATKAGIKKRLSRLLGKEVIPGHRVDPRVIGGIVVRVGDRIMDGSIRRRLQQMRRSLLRAEI